MGVIIGDGENRGVTIWTNNKPSKNNNLVFAFHGTPLIKPLAKRLQAIETGYKTESKVFMPYTKGWTATMSHARLVKEMDKYYQLTKQDLLDAKTIDVVAHSYGPIKALAFLHAIAKDEENAPKILAKVKNLHLYNGLINTDRDENHRFTHNIKVFIFKIRIFFMSLLRGEFKMETPDVVKSLINLRALQSFKPRTTIAYNPSDLLAPSSEPFMEKVRMRLTESGVTGVMIDDSTVLKYGPISENIPKNKDSQNETVEDSMLDRMLDRMLHYASNSDRIKHFTNEFIQLGQHQTDTGIVERMEILQRKMVAKDEKVTKSDANSQDSTDCKRDDELTNRGRLQHGTAKTWAKKIEERSNSTTPQHNQI